MMPMADPSRWLARRFRIIAPLRSSAGMGRERLVNLPSDEDGDLYGVPSSGECEYMLRERQRNGRCFAPSFISQA